MVRTRALPNLVTESGLARYLKDIGRFPVLQPGEEHLLVARVTGRAGVDLHTQDALGEYLEGRQYEPLFTWPEQGLEVYLVGASAEVTDKANPQR